MTITVDCFILTETERAYLLSRDENRKHGEWCAKSLIEEVVQPNALLSKEATVTLPEWLAKKAGLI